MGIKFANYGQERERIATETELEIFETIRSLSGADDVDLVRKCDDYLSVVIGEWDLARIKYTPRAKWVVLPLSEYGTKKLRIESPGDVAVLAGPIKKSVETIRSFT